MKRPAARHLWMLGLWLALSATQVTARDLTGRVTRVVDGDSLWLQPDKGGKPLEVRLSGIDAPEICQPWGRQAREALEALVMARAVTLHTVGRDVYGRTLGVLSVDGLNVNVRQVGAGHAWSGRWRNGKGPHIESERMARILRRGMHAQRELMMPHEFRRVHGPCTSTTEQKPVRTERCDGRTRCAQMTSCEEATYFLQHCPRAQMDGDRNGVPCERQWCQR